MKTSTFNRIFENARSVNIQSNEWFNYAGFFWTVKNGEEWYILNSGTLIKVH